jgi:succinate-acetate transporter protein
MKRALVVLCAVALAGCGAFLAAAYLQFSDGERFAFVFCIVLGVFWLAMPKDTLE